MPDVSIIIINWNTRELLRDCLQSIAETSGELDVEVLVVDNGSNDDSRSMVAKAFPWVALIQNRENIGFAGANNQAFSQARGRYLLLLNSDTLVRSHAIAEMCAFMDTHDTAGACGPKLLNSDGSVQRSCWRGFPSLRTALMDAFYLPLIAPWMSWVRASEISERELQNVVEVDHLLGACMMVRREVVDRIGAMEERFFLFLEETDWCYRMKQAGLGIYVVPSAHVIHFGQRSVHQEPERTLPELFRSLVIFCRLHGHPSQGRMLLLKAVIACGALVRVGLWTWRSRVSECRTQARRMRSGYCETIRRVPFF